MPFRELLTELVNRSLAVGIEGTRQYVANCATQFLVARSEHLLLPLTVNDSQLDNCYVCSPYSGAISYPLVELREVNNVFLRFGLAGLIRSVSPLLRYSGVNRVVCINNWMLSTNLYPQWDGSGLSELRDALIERYPGHAILVRSLNNATNASLIQSAKENRFLLAPSRQVYITNESEPEYLRHQNCRWDRKLVEQSDYTVVQHDDLKSTDDERINHLYDMLYLEKYTQLNPQFTARLIQLWRETKSLKLIGLRSSSGSLDGVVGCFRRGGVLTAPLIGYDTALPQKLGLYRMLMAIMFQESSDGGFVLNLSSGAASFKRLRGGKPHLEYTAVYCDHLSGYQRRAWQSLAALLTQVGGRVLQRLEL